MKKIAEKHENGQTYIQFGKKWLKLDTSPGKPKPIETAPGVIVDPSGKGLVLSEAEQSSGFSWIDVAVLSLVVVAGAMIIIYAIKRNKHK